MDAKTFTIEECVREPSDFEKQFSWDPEVTMFSLKGHSDPLETRFNCPVYCVGSFLTKGSDALDIDIVMVMKEDQILRLFRDLHFNDRWFRFYMKQKEWYEVGIKCYDIDFKVQTVKQFMAHEDKPRVRLGKSAIWSPVK